MRSGCGSGGGSGRGERPAGRGWRARPMLNLGGVVITAELSARALEFHHAGRPEKRVFINTESTLVSHVTRRQANSGEQQYM
ncbi:beta-1,3-galactosyltransferase 1 isoform X2 [Chiroxiphia lanceolata]|uniref:beta-1,3-galactosyltransferase 1 isoform X2 n=1 Tax=Chiroxiphia lanceolata TaxID=296741 RepID=UPI0013CEB0BC|nr:beta-1,3-galactosyltransferase 1 isoform X2 [Chiroxiphia lanceolata]